ncbi:alpha/beta fold hydrolase (plasmid) [Haloferax mediterranei ATCC 33500]|uniref:Alpha/beta fold hydrolase n=2 Tax=Haloferax mediterranei TaxID=2252 RepID=I3RAC8_HALMT|nr:alpha/beta fold hydrolase [Haloferax mediterranei]ADY18553.1 PhaC2 [Haloferax mediterranei]AFK21188.1 poly(3-hydroxyalkanoate) synthase subunit PhaC [Haloferax mediterranei ATCC 33500]ELZ97477.1 poly(3-hydroxyalkanoate) synthase subunit PhaC [Haloferax mediterranei ATCC 33500]MDX5990231.1 alpha/beta fold hydrolase [Haloferax mediterranei ATCC 33500]QCQ76698.1 alpha/beta fold hydrolase [Haloferax mediterranei ATCC 33500]
MFPNLVGSWRTLPVFGVKTALERHSRNHETTTPLEPTPSDVVYTENKLELRHYQPRPEVQQNVPILLVYAIINRPSILDFQPDRSVVQQFLDQGFDVFLLDWGAPSVLDAHLGLEDFVTRYLANCVDVVTERTEADALHLFGYCTGATLAAIFAALYPQLVRTLGMLAPVLNFDVDGGIFDLWGREESYNPQHLVDTFGNAPGEWLAMEFSLVDPVEYHLARYLSLYEHIADEEFLSRFLRRLQWGFDTVDVAGELYTEFLVDLYRENRLMKGTLSVGGETIDLETLEMPILDIIGMDDQFIPAEASLPFIEAVPSTDTTVIEYPADHVGLSTGEGAHTDLWPRVCEWFAARSEASPNG